MNTHLISTLKTVLNAQLDDSARQWLEESCACCVISKDENVLFTHSAGARRHCGDQQFVHQGHENLSDYCSEQWSLTDAARILLTALACNTLTVQERPTLLKNYYRCGDELEKSALLKGMNLLDSDGTAVQIAINACRVNSLVIYNAIALHNLYPSTFFPELNWNQLVLKTLFQRLDINNIMGLEARQSPSLSAMCVAYAEELILADRDPPPSIWLAVRLDDLDQHATHLLTQFLHSNNPLHRLYVTTSLSRQTISAPETRRLLHAAIDLQRRQETDDAVLHLLTELNFQGNAHAVF